MAEVDTKHNKGTDLIVWSLNPETKQQPHWIDVPDQLCKALKAHRVDTHSSNEYRGSALLKPLEANGTTKISLSSTGLSTARQLVFLVPVIATYPDDPGDPIKRAAERKALRAQRSILLEPQRIKQWLKSTDDSRSLTEFDETEDREGEESFGPPPPAYPKQIVLNTALLEFCIHFWTAKNLADFAFGSVKLQMKEFSGAIGTTDVNDARIKSPDYIVGYLLLAHAIVTGGRVPFSFVGVHDMGLHETADKPWPRALLQYELNVGSKPRPISVPWSKEALDLFPALKYQHVYLVRPWPGPTASPQWTVPYENRHKPWDQKQLALVRHDSGVWDRLVAHNVYALRKVTAWPSTLEARANVQRALGTHVPEDIKDYVIEQYESHVSGCALCQTRLSGAQIAFAQKKMALYQAQYGKKMDKGDKNSDIGGCAACSWGLHHHTDSSSRRLRVLQDRLKKKKKTAMTREEEDD